MTKAEKDNIDRLVQIFVSGMDSPANDAGWEGTSMSARIMEYLGQPPAPTGNDQSNLHMINSIRLLALRNPEYPFIAAAMAILTASQDTVRQAEAICAKHYYRGLCTWTDRTWTNAGRAEMVEQTEEEFKWNLSRAYYSIANKLAVVRICSQYIA